MFDYDHQQSLYNDFLDPQESYYEQIHQEFAPSLPDFEEDDGRLKEYMAFFKDVQPRVQQAYLQLSKVGDSCWETHGISILLGDSQQIVYQSYQAPYVFVHDVLFKGSVVLYRVVLGCFLVQVKLLNLRIASKQKQCYIGKGSFGEVFEINSSQDERPCIAKRIRLECIEKQNLSSSQERASQYALSDKIRNVVVEYAFYKIFSFLKIGPAVDVRFGFEMVCYNDAIQFYMEKCEQNYLNIIGFSIPQFVRRLKYCVRFIHELKIVHKDLKPHNILYSHNLRNLVLTDFGISHTLKQQIGEKSYTCRQGTSFYMCAEMSEMQPGQKRLVDLYYNDFYCIKKTIESIGCKSEDLSKGTGYPIIQGDIVVYNLVKEIHKFVFTEQQEDFGVLEKDQRKYIIQFFPDDSSRRRQAGLWFAKNCFIFRIYRKDEIEYNKRSTSGVKKTSLQPEVQYKFKTGRNHMADPLLIMERLNMVNEWKKTQKIVELKVDELNLMSSADIEERMIGMLIKYFDRNVSLFSNQERCRKIVDILTKVSKTNSDLRKEIYYRRMIFLAFSQKVEELQKELDLSNLDENHTETLLRILASQKMYRPILEEQIKMLSLEDTRSYHICILMDIMASNQNYTEALEIVQHLTESTSPQESLSIYYTAMLYRLHLSTFLGDYETLEQSKSILLNFLEKDSEEYEILRVQESVATFIKKEGALKKILGTMIQLKEAKKLELDNTEWIRLRFNYEVQLQQSQADRLSIAQATIKECILDKSYNAVCLSLDMIWEVVMCTRSPEKRQVILKYIKIFERKMNTNKLVDASRKAQLHIMQCHYNNLTEGETQLQVDLAKFPLDLDIDVVGYPMKEIKMMAQVCDHYTEILMVNKPLNLVQISGIVDCGRRMLDLCYCDQCLINKFAVKNMWRLWKQDRTSECREQIKKMDLSKIQKPLSFLGPDFLMLVQILIYYQQIEKAWSILDSTAEEALTSLSCSNRFLKNISQDRFQFFIQAYYSTTSKLEKFDAFIVHIIALRNALGKNIAEKNTVLLGRCLTVALAEFLVQKNTQNQKSAIINVNKEAKLNQVDFQQAKSFFMKQLLFLQDSMRIKNLLFNTHQKDIIPCAYVVANIEQNPEGILKIDEQQLFDKLNVLTQEQSHWVQRMREELLRWGFYELANRLQTHRQ